VSQTVVEVEGGVGGCILTLLPPELYESEIYEAVLTLLPPEVVEDAEAED